MPVRLTITFAAAAAVAVALGASDAVRAQSEPQYRIMVEEGAPPKKPAKKPANTGKDNGGEPPQRTEKPRPRPRGSSTYIPPPVPSPYGDPGLARVPAPGVYRPPPIDSFGDRVTRCMHSYPLVVGQPGQPTDRDTYIRQCANN